MKRRTLRFGSTGLQVEQLQGLLKKKGLFQGYKTTMFFGAITRRELKKFQGRAGLKKDGICGPASWAALLRLPKPSAPPVPPRKPTLPRKPPSSASPQVIQFIADFEGWFSKPYNDPVGHCTIGYGTLLHRGNCTSTDMKTWGTITKTRSLQLLQREIDLKIVQILKLVKVKLNQHELDALISFAYNVGTGALAESTLLRKLNAGDRTGAAKEFGRWVNADGVKLPGLVRRREAERRLFLYGFKAGSSTPKDGK
jgi:GH24 family phage-related lysozyme (muramidase)